MRGKSYEMEMGLQRLYEVDRDVRKNGRYLVEREGSQQGMDTRRGKSHEMEMDLQRLYKVDKDVRKNGRYSVEQEDSQQGMYIRSGETWDVLGTQQLYLILSFVIFFIVQCNHSLSSVDVGMVCGTTLKSRVPFVLIVLSLCS